MSTILIQLNDGSSIQRTINPGDDLCTIGNAHFEYTDPTYSNISITLDTPGTYRLTQQLLAKCNFSLIATVPNVIISAGTAGEVFSTITTHDEYDESIIKVIETPGTTVKAIIKNITFDFIGIIGGNLWIRNSAKNPIIENIKIINNTFCKHGNDEAIGIWTLTVANTGNTLRNILISGNHIEYTYPTDDSVNYTNHFQPNDVLIKIYGERTNVLFDQATGCPDKSSYPPYYEHIMDNIIISDNIFHIKDLVHKVVSFWCDGYVKTKNIIAQNNTIIIDDINFSGHDSYRTIGVFANNDILGTDLEVTIANNTIISKCVFKNDTTPTVEALSIYGGHTHFKNNIIKTDGNGELIGISIRNNLGITQSSNNTDYSQTASINCRNFVKLDLDGNTFKNLFLLGSFSYTGIGQYDIIFLNMTNNTLSGSTKIYCNNIATMHSVIMNNSFNYKNEAYCFQNYAHNGTLRFCYSKTSPQNNYTYRDCYLYKHYGTAEDLSHFNLVTLIDNVFTNINSSTNFSGIPTQSLIEHNNTYTESTQN